MPGPFPNQFRAGFSHTKVTQSVTYERLELNKPAPNASIKPVWRLHKIEESRSVRLERCAVRQRI